MGVIYKAQDTKLKRTVVLKFLPPELTKDPEAKKCFVHEAQAASALDHSNICTIHEIDEFPIEGREQTSVQPAYKYCRAIGATWSWNQNALFSDDSRIPG